MIKARPEDFVVEERADLPLRPGGRHRVYLLRKRHWNTDDLVRHLARQAGVPRAAFSYGGRKDKHGLTSQFVSVDHPADLSGSGRDFELTAQGAMDRPMGPDLILANAFRITIRDLADPGPLESGLREVAAEGFLNYFDDQRFRSYDPERGFFAEKILRGHWNGALQVLLTSITPDLPGWEKERRAELFRVWKDWPACLARAEGFLEKEIFSFLREHPAEFGLALHRVPEDEVSMQFAVLQGHLWNELLRRLVVRKAARTREVAGREGPYVFWESPHPGLSAFLKELELPTAAVRMSWPDEMSASLFAEILREKVLKPGDFRTRELRRVRFKSFPRRAVVFPDKLEVREKGGDELHPGRKRLTLAFELPRGSYATILVKRISG